MEQHMEAFKAYLENMKYMQRAITLLQWDMETTTPKNGFEGQADALAYFSTELFRLSTADELKDLLDALEQKEVFDKLDEGWQFIVKKMKKDWEESKRIPVEFFESFVRAQAEAGNAWKEAKQKKEYKIFAPHLEKVIQMVKEMASYTNPSEDVYQVLLNQYEEGMDQETIDRLFEELKADLLPLLDRIAQKEEPDISKFEGYYDIEAQRKVQKLLLEYIGFDFERGAVGETEHPFTTNFDSKDVRVTNHYYEDNAISAMFSAIHEGGHAIFEQNVNPDYDGTVAGSCQYMGIHESQSRFYENILGRNIHFWEPIYQKVGELLPKFQEISLEDFYHEINYVKNSLIRIEADELTYCFHIIIRYELEKAIFKDNVSVDELPKLWNQKMEEYLHVVPEHDSEGILQDTHWSGASFGYFPSYLLGSIYDGMYLQQVEKELGSVDEILKKGEIKKITKWLNENIHQYGSTRLPKEVIQNVCGTEVSAKPLITHFEKKYTELYQL